jgi:hypothetical protein
VLAIAIVACILFFRYWDMQHITHLASGWFGKILGFSSSFADSWKQSEAPQITGRGDDRWDFLWSDEHSSTLGSYATERPVCQGN